MYDMSPGKLQQTSLLAVVLLLSCLLWPVGTQASELLMFERDGCVWCQRWDREIGSVYDKTAEARVLPLRRVNTGNQAAGGVTLASPAISTTMHSGDCSPPLLPGLQRPDRAPTGSDHSGFAF
jgi:hypothetical protein